MKKTMIIISVIAVTIIACGSLLGLKSHTGNLAPAVSTSPAPPPPSRSVALEQALIEASNKNRSYPGTVQASKTTALAFRVGGPLVRVNVKPGDTAKKGAILMQIDPQDFKDTLNVLEAQLMGAQSQLLTAKFDFSRSQQLFAEKVISQADFDHSKNAEKLAESSVKQIKAQLIMARHKLSYTTLKAPYDAIVTTRMIENHEMVSPGRAVVILHDISMLEIHVNVPENEMVSHPLTAGAPARASFPSLGNQYFDVTLKEWSTVADQSSKTYEVTYAMASPDKARILPGMTAEITWSHDKTDNRVITVPAKALVTDTSGASCVWVFDRKTASASKKHVVPGNFSGRARVIVETGLTGNELIVTEGMDFLTPGQALSYVIKNTSEKIN